METLWCLHLGRHSGSRGFQQVPRRECQWTAVQVDIGLGLKINIFNIYNMIIDYDIQFISFDLLTVLTGMVFMSNPDEVEYSY